MYPPDWKAGAAADGRKPVRPHPSRPGSRKPGRRLPNEPSAALDRGRGRDRSSRQALLAQGRYRRPMLARVIAAPEVVLLLLSVVFVGVPAFVVGQRRGSRGARHRLRAVRGRVDCDPAFDRQERMASRPRADPDSRARALYLGCVYGPCWPQRTRWWALPFLIPGANIVAFWVYAFTLEPAVPVDRQPWPGCCSRSDARLKHDLVESLVRGITPGRFITEGISSTFFAAARPSSDAPAWPKSP